MIKEKLSWYIIIIIAFKHNYILTKTVQCTSKPHIIKQDFYPNQSGSQAASYEVN